MSRLQSMTPPAGWRFSMKIAAPILVATLLVLGLTTYGILQATRQSDETSIARQVRTAETAIASSIQKLAHDVEVVAVWNDAVTYTSPSGFDGRWIDDNIGVWLYRMFDHDRVVVLDGADRPIYAMADGKRTAPDRYEEIGRDVADLVSGTRRMAARVTSEPTERKSTGRAVQLSAFRLVAGRPAAVSAMRIVPHTDDFPPAPAGQETLLLSVRFLDGTFLEDQRVEHLLDGARYSADGVLMPGERALPLQDNTGRSIGFLVWHPEAPGEKILAHLLPFYLATAASVVALMLMLLHVLRKSSNELRASEAHAQHLALHDVLTGHPNRAQLMSALDEALVRIRPETPGSQERFALLLLDLDRFKHVNDALGHQAGDGLIREFADRLSALVRRGDLVARLGGDEFAIVQRHIGGRHDTEALCRRILDAVEHPFHLVDDVNASVGVSIGIAIAPDAGTDAVGLLRKADIALYRAKAEGRGRSCFFTADMDELVREQSKMETELRGALERREGLMVHYQPQMSQDGKILTGLEALVRWQHPQLGFLPPARFLQVADDCGLSVKIDEWVLEHTCSIIDRLPPVTVAVNLSPAQFYTDDLVERVMAIVQRHGVDPRRIELEITERVLLEDNTFCHDILRRLRAAGFTVALDDFGTGYSSLSYLRRFRVDKIKIDQSFVRHIGRSRESTSIVRAIIGMGQAMGVTVTAEGVEDTDQHRFLAQHGCDQLQGYLFSRPISAEALSDFIRQDRSERSEMSASAD